jgi:ABC-2 type transport system permease protein
VIRRPLPFGAQLLDALLIELTNWRWAWRSMVIVDTIAPLLSILGLGVFARDLGATALGYVLTGNMVMALMFGTMHKVQGHLLYMRRGGMLDYFSTLPMRKDALILAVMLGFLLLSLPALLVTGLVGAWVLGLRLAPHPAMLLVIPACAISLTGIGALIGVRARTPQEAGSYSLLLTLLLLSVGPVVVPPERLPWYLLWLGQFSPATYAASALRQTLLGPVTAQLASDLAMLGGFAVLTFWLVNRQLSWRQN